MSDVEWWHQCVLQMIEDGAKPPNFGRLQERLASQYTNPRSLANKWYAMLKKMEQGTSPVTSPKGARNIIDGSPKKRAVASNSSPRKVRRKLDFEQTALNKDALQDCIQEEKNGTSITSKDENTGG